MEIIFDSDIDAIKQNLNYFNYVKHKIKNIDYHYFINEQLHDQINDFNICFENITFYTDFNKFQKCSDYIDIIKKYDWVIHYNLKHMLCEPNFIKYFFSLKKNLFVKESFEDLYIISNDSLMDYILSDKKSICEFECEKEYSVGNLLINKNNKLYYI